MFSVAGLSTWRGGWAARTVAWGMVVSSIATAVFQDIHNWSGTQWGDLAVDTIYLVVLIWVALRSERLWTLFPAAFQLVSVIVYGARIADWHVGARAPYAAEAIFSYLILVLALIGTWQNWRDRRTVYSPSPPSTSTGTSAT